MVAHARSSLLCFLACFVVLVSVPGCLGSSEAELAMSALTSREHWASVEPHWICDGETCGYVPGGPPVEWATYYMQFSEDGRVRRAYPSIAYPYDREGEATIRCQSGHWELDGDVIELRFPATKTDPAIVERRRLSHRAGYARAYREDGHEQEQEDWKYGAGNELGWGDYDSPCPATWSTY